MQNKKSRSPFSWSAAPPANEGRGYCANIGILHITLFFFNYLSWFHQNIYILGTTEKIFQRAFILVQFCCSSSIFLEVTVHWSWTQNTELKKKLMLCYISFLESWHHNRVCLSTHWYVHWSICWSICWSVCQFICWSTLCVSVGPLVVLLYSLLR